MRRKIAKILVAAAAFAAIPAMAEAAGPGPHGRHGGNSATPGSHGRHLGNAATHGVRIVVRPGVRAGHPVYRRPAVHWTYRPFAYRARPYHYGPVYRPFIYVAPRPVIYAPPPVVYAAPAAPVAQPAQPVQTAAEPERYCREYQTTITVAGRTEQAYGTACQEPDGAWMKID